MIGLPVPAVAVVALIAFGVGASGSYYVMTAKRNAELVAMYKAGQKALAGKQEILNAYESELTKLRDRKPKRVLYCPPTRLPAGPGGAGSADPGVAEERDIGPLLRACYDELLRADKLREYVK